MGAVEHVGGGGEIRLLRDKRFQNSDGTDVGIFTLENVQEFVLEAEVAGVAPTDQMWFRFMPADRRVECMYFPTEGHVDYAPPKPRRNISASGAQSAFMWLGFIVGIVCGVLIGAMIFGG